MTELDHASLDRVLPSTPGEADWDDVMGRFRGYQRHRRRRLVVFAAVALVAVVTASAFGVRVLFLDKGFIGLPPQGATPSTPERGELVLHYFGANPGVHGKSRIWVYADGRLISLRDADYPEGANSYSTGFLEQRLTPEGVELLRSEVISSGLHASSGGEALSPDTEIEVRDGDRLVAVKRASDPERLVARITNPAAWLPATAWDTQETRAYVPSRFAVCYGTWPPTQTDASHILSLLPAEAQQILGGKDTKTLKGMYSLGRDIHPASEHCSEVTIDEARALAKTFDDAGPAERGPERAARLGYRFHVVPGREDVLVYFEPYLPHGEFTCSACG